MSLYNLYYFGEWLEFILLTAVIGFIILQSIKGDTD